MKQLDYPLVTRFPDEGESGESGEGDGEGGRG